MRLSSARHSDRDFKCVESHNVNHSTPECRHPIAIVAGRTAKTESMCKNSRLAMVMARHRISGPRKNQHGKEIQKLAMWK
jgi:hypothetical protein